LIANALASVSIGLTFGGLLIAVIAIIAAMEWGHRTASKIAATAHELVEKRANDKISEWLTNEAPAIIRRHVEFLNDTSVGQKNDKEAAEEYGDADL
jgi:hypothetical protein